MVGFVRCERRGGRFGVGVLEVCRWWLLDVILRSVVELLLQLRSERNRIRNFMSWSAIRDEEAGRGEVFLQCLELVTPALNHLTFQSVRAEIYRLSYAVFKLLKLRYQPPPNPQRLSHRPAYNYIHNPSESLPL
jgi:hypothetical protein